MVGKLQSNKVKKAVKLFDFIHSLDNKKLALMISKYQKELKKEVKLFIQINLAAEEQKSGLLLTNLNNFYNYCVSELSLNIVGLRAAIASYQDQRFQKNSIAMNNKAKTIVTDYLDTKGVQYLDFQTNFIFIKTDIEITELQPAMEKNGVLVGRPFPPFTNWCRLSLAKPEEMQKFNEAFEKVLG